MRVGGLGQKVSFAFLFLVLLKEMRTGGVSPRFHLVILVSIKITKRLGESKILLRASASYTLLGSPI